MMELIAGAFISFIEKELINHEPEIQQLIIDQINKLSTILINYIDSKNSPEVNKLENPNK